MEQGRHDWNALPAKDKQAIIDGIASDMKLNEYERALLAKAAFPYWERSELYEVNLYAQKPKDGGADRKGNISFIAGELALESSFIEKHSADFVALPMDTRVYEHGLAMMKIVYPCYYCALTKGSTGFFWADRTESPWDVNIMDEAQGSTTYCLVMNNALKQAMEELTIPQRKIFMFMALMRPAHLLYIRSKGEQPGINAEVSAFLARVEAYRSLTRDEALLFQSSAHALASRVPGICPEINNTIRFGSMRSVSDDDLHGVAQSISQAASVDLSWFDRNVVEDLRGPPAFDLLRQEKTSPCRSLRDWMRLYLSEFNKDTLSEEHKLSNHMSELQSFAPQISGLEKIQAGDIIFRKLSNSAFGKPSEALIVVRAQTSSLAVSAIAGKKIESFRNEQELLASLPIGSSFIPFDKLDEIDDERYHHMRLAQARFDLLAKHLDKVDALRREKTRDTVIWQPDNRRFTLVYDRKELSFSIYLSSLLCHGDRTGDFHETWHTLIIEDGRSNTTRISTSSRLGLQFGLRDYACGESDIFHSRLIQHVFFNATDETLYLGMHSIWLLGLYRIIKVPNREAGVSPTFAFVSTDHMEKHGYILENFDGGIGGQSLLRPFGFIKNLRLWPDQPAYPAAANPRMQSNAVPIILTFIIAWVIPAIYPMFVWWNTRNIYMSIVLGCVGYSFAVYLISKLPRSKALAVWCLMMLDVFGRRAGTCCLHILRLANDQAIVRRFDRVSVDYLTDRDVDNAAPIFARIERGSLVSILNNWIERFEADKARQILAHPAIPDDLREYASRRVALRLEVQQGILENARERAHGRAYAQAFQETIYWKGLPDLQKIWFQDGRSASLYDLARNLTLDDFRQALQYAQEFQARLTSMNMVDDKTVSTWIPAACRSVTSLPAFQQYLDALAVSIIQNHIIEDFQHIKWELALYSIIEQDELLLRMFDKHGLHKDAPAGCWTFVYFRTVLAPAPENIKKAVSKLYIEETTSDWQNRSADERTQYLRDLARENELTENDWILLNHAVDPETAGGQQVRDGGLLIPVLAFAAGVFIFVILIPWLTYTGGK
ncbi:MAG TPA: hypothetical protein PK562_03910, partial [Candidatus Omnitrophota bacterium]|nr:hypothetical protein [Candidatus Omnitrophota bacterium]